jgi:hypothetical protein
MDDERWLTHLLDVCRVELEEAHKREFSPPGDYLEDLRRVIDDIELRLAEMHRAPRIG